MTARLRRKPPRNGKNACKAAYRRGPAVDLGCPEPNRERDGWTPVLASMQSNGLRDDGGAVFENFARMKSSAIVHRPLILIGSSSTFQLAEYGLVENDMQMAALRPCLSFERHSFALLASWLAVEVGHLHGCGGKPGHSSLTMQQSHSQEATGIDYEGKIRMYSRMINTSVLRICMSKCLLREFVAHEMQW